MDREGVVSWIKGLLASLRSAGSAEASVALYVREGGELTRFAVGGPDAEALFEARIPGSQGPYAFALIENEPLYLPDAEEEERVMECYLNSFAEVIAPVFPRSGPANVRGARGGAPGGPSGNSPDRSSDGAFGDPPGGSADRSTNGSPGERPDGADRRAVGLLVARRSGPDSFQPDEVSGIIAWAKNFPN